MPDNDKIDKQGSEQQEMAHELIEDTLKRLKNSMGRIASGEFDGGDIAVALMTMIEELIFLESMYGDDDLEFGTLARRTIKEDIGLIMVLGAALAQKDLNKLDAKEETPEDPSKHESH